MKKIALIVIIECSLLPAANAAADSIYEYLQQVDENTKIVLGAKAKGGDSFAAIDVAIGLKKFNVNQPDLETVIEDEVIPQQSKILIGNPCDNELMPITCDDWSYSEGQAIIRVSGNDLIIAGTTLEDTRRAAKIIAYYKNYELLKETKSIIVTGKGFQEITATKEKVESEMVCGDSVCDPGERCYSDCSQETCFDICEEEGYNEASCRDKKSNPSVASCLAEERDKGSGYCATGKVCCCKKIVEDKPIEDKRVVEEEKVNAVILWQKILLFFKRLFSLE